MNENVSITNFIGIGDLLTTPIFLIVIYFFLFTFSKKIISEPELRKYFIYGITVKIAGAIMLGMVYQFYYGGAGDTALYFAIGGKILYTLLQDPMQGLKLLIYPEAADNMYNISPFLARYQHDKSTFLIGRISGFFSLLSFNTYLTVSIFFAISTFYGIWKLFKLLYYLFPEIRKQLAVAFLFYPSIIFWGSGVMKDGVALSALCLGFYCLCNIVKNNRGKVKYILGLAVSIYLMSYIKIYITLCFIPTGFLWVFSTYNNSIKSSVLRWVSWPIVIVSGLLVGIYSSSLIAENDARYRLDKLAETAQTTSSYLTRVSIQEEGSYYSLGQYDASLSGMLPKMPQAIWVSLFRPYLWEIKNPLMLLSSLESLTLLVFTFLVLFRTGFAQTFSIIFNNPFLLFCLVFTLVFSFAIGISTYNFGTLVRYKIPMLPFYATMLFYISNYSKMNKRIRF